MLRTTEEIVESLRDALAGVGVRLPSLCVDPVTGASGEPFALVDLGRCNVRTAERLTDVLNAMSVGEELRVKVRQVNRQRRSR
ncbi:hypothetical protein [Streptomyces monashensis]|uniref:Uncharacterized protein n=1 Tax=Streptomyces monashensis TaxID=1678012 RepID=A0A1S2QEF3_9ACTN|nr:hypothetical protein [Streptomyces monashensis]OIK04027.1 hypothetical protein BIV23_19505 [Streptomyces monashensis]